MRSFSPQEEQSCVHSLICDTSPPRLRSFSFRNFSVTPEHADAFPACTFECQRLYPRPVFCQYRRPRPLYAVLYAGAPAAEFFRYSTSLPISRLSLFIMRFSSRDMYDCDIPSLSATSFASAPFFPASRSAFPLSLFPVWSKGKRLPEKLFFRFLLYAAVHNIGLRAQHIA